MRRTRKLAAFAGIAAAASLVAAGATVPSVAGATVPSVAVVKPVVRPLTTAGLMAHLPASALRAAKAHPLRAVPAAPASAPVATRTAMGAGNEATADLVSAGVTFTMPTITCKRNTDAEWLLPGLWIYDLGSGNLTSQVDVNFNCEDGALIEVGVVCVNGGACQNSMAVSPGDVMEAVFTQNANGAIGTLYDRTQHTNSQETGTYDEDATVLFGDAGPSQFGVSVVPTFTSQKFTTATLNGFYLGDWGPGLLSLETGSFVQIKSTYANNTSFTTTFVHNA